MTRASLVGLALMGCRKETPPADPEFSDALIFLFREFESAEADLAFGIRDLEEQAYADLDVTASNPNDRALQPEVLVASDVADLERSNDDRDLSLAIPVAVAGLSAFSPSDHAGLQVQVDHTGWEPYSPDHYVREFFEGEDCFADASCDTLRTTNDLTKDNILMTVDYEFLKDFRWIDLSLPDPSDVTTTEAPAPVGPSRLAMLGRSWTDKSYAGQSGNSFIHQTYTVELWIPRSEDGGALRLLCLWSETEFDGLSVSDDTVIATTRSGIDQNFQAADEWLEEN